MENNNFTNMDFEMPSEVLDKIQENIQDIIKSFDIPDDNKMDVIKKSTLCTPKQSTCLKRMHSQD